MTNRSQKDLTTKKNLTDKPNTQKVFNKKVPQKQQSHFSSPDNSVYADVIMRVISSILIFSLLSDICGSPKRSMHDLLNN